MFDTSATYPGFDQLVAEELEVPGHDGTMIPLSIIHRKDLKLDGSSNAINYNDGHFTEDKAVTFKNFAGQDAFLLWQTGDKDFQPSR